MKTKCSFILKSSIALILTALMIFGSVSTVLAATIDMAETGATTIYFKNTLGWSSVYAYRPDGWNNNGCYNTGTGTIMTKVSGTKDLYSCSVNYTDRIAFASAQMDNYGNFYGNSAAYSTSFNSKYPVYYPGTTYKTVNSTNYYNEDKNAFWIAYDVKLYGDSSFASGWSTSSTASMSIDATTGYYKYTFTPTSAKTEYFRILFGGSEKYCPNSGSDTTIGGENSKQLYKYGENGAFNFSSDTSHRYTIWMDLVEKKVWYTSEAISTNYTGITAVAKGTTDGTSYSVDLGSIQSSTTVSSSTGLAVTAPTQTGYTFSKWVASGSGTFVSDTSASTTFYPAANSEVATAQYKKSYTISKNSPTGGTVTLSKSTGVLAGETFTVTLSASDGYKLESLTVGGTDVTSYVLNNSYTATASGASDTIAVVANFEAIPATTIYIKTTMPTFSYAHFYDPDNSDTNISDAGAWPGDKFTDWSTTTDGKYYYKAYTWDCSNFKLILNDNGSNQTGSGSSVTNKYATGKSYYIDTATNGTQVTLTEGVPQSSTITYPTGNFTIGGTMPASAYTGETVSFTVTAADGYRIDEVQFTPAGGTATTITPSSGTYSFTMPDSAVTVSVTTVKTYTVTLTAGTGIATKQYKLGSSGTYADYSSALTVDTGTDVYFKVTYDTGYEYASNSGLSVVTANTEFNTGSVAANKTVSITAQKITWAGLTAVGKYSTTAADDASYSNVMTTNPATINAASATQLDGVAVSVPANDPEGYVFAGWYTTTGTFANDANKDTTFYPNAANAVAIAKYKKIFTITSSVDSTGTGAGTVTTSVASVVAGGSYTITSSAATGSAIESITINDTAVSSPSASYIKSSVSADQTVVVKFKSNVYLKGTMNATAWAGDVMQANSDGTSYTISEVVLEAEEYQFRLYADDEWKANSVTTWTLNNIATHSTSGNNLTITPSVKAKVTFVSDGTKFTSITAIPYDSTTYNVTLTQSADYTITSTYMGVEYTTSGKNADVTVPVYSGTELSYTVTPASGKYLSGVAQSNSVALSPAFDATTHANSYTGTVSSVSEAFAVSATAASKLSVKAVTNKSARGTVSVDKSTAAPGETITITVTPLSGSFAALTATYANGAVYTYDLTEEEWSCTTAATKTAGASTGALSSIFVNPFSKADLAATGAEAEAVSTAATRELYPTGAASDITMTLAEASAVTINATFDSYSAESNYYYNGYDTSGNALSGYHDKQMTEVLLNGVPYSYYEVSGRSGGDQLMTVSKKSSTGNTGYAYFTRPSNWGSVWSNSKAPYAYFFNDSGQVGASYPGTMMTFISGNDFKIAIPDGATKVIFSDSESGGSGAQTVDITMTSSTSAYYLNGNYQDVDGTRKYEVSAWGTQPSDAGIQVTTTEYWYNASDRYYGYVNGFNESGNNWNSHNAGSHTSDGDRFAKPGLNSSESYYVMVFYAGNTYTSGSGTLDLTGSANHDVVMWAKELPSGSDDENVTVYAKDGSIRSDSSGSTYANIADTKIYAADGTTTVGTKHNGNITNQTWETYKAAKGDTLVIKTQIGATDDGTLSDSADLKAKYYVRGFCVNGEVSELLEWNENGLYTLTYKIPEDTEITKFEITPIYYLKNTTANPIVTYRVTGFTDELKQVGSGTPNWGDTLYTYPFYGTYGGQNNAFGAYPGQPMVYYKGQYQMQIPQKDTAWDPYSGTDATTLAGTSVSGVTMSNGYFDIVHRQIMGYGDDSTSADHVQTYDYGDFYKIFNEKAPVDNIVFDFKYETKKHNLTDIITGSTTASDLTNKYGDTNGNGFELLTNFHGRTVDLFGTPLSGDAADPAKTKPLYVVSMGGVDGNVGVENIAGYYATEWNVYAPTTTTGTPASTDAYSRISDGGKNSIPPEVLVLNASDSTSFNTSTYPSAVAEGSGDYNYAVTDWQDLYEALEDYRGIPVMISYESASMQVGAKNHTTSGAGGATRNDGRWLYSKNGENITSTIKIQYSDDNGTTYTDLNTTTPQVSGLSAYFTNDGVEGEMTYSTTIDPDKTFDFEAKTTNANYKFVGWYMADGTKITSDNASHTERSGSYTFVAKFMQVTSGQLILSHSADKGTISSTDYQGEGTAKIGVVVKNGDEVIRTIDLTTSDITLDDKIIKSDNSDYTIEVTLEATATGSDVLGPTVLANPSGQDATFFTSSSTTTVDKTRTIVLDSFTVGDLFTNGTTQSVKNIIYHSYFTQAVFHYKLKFEYTDRFGNAKVFYRDGNLTSAQAANTNYVERVENGAYSDRYLRPAFIETIAPHVSNFGEDITWNLQERTFSFTVNDYYYNCDHYITATTTGNDKRNVTFKLPYEHTNGIATGGNAGTAATSTNFKLIGDNAVTFDTIPVLLNNGENGIYTDDTWKKWIAAPATLSDNGTTKYFQYWSVKSTSADGENDPEVARCYFQGFNFVALDNYTVTPIYDTDPVDITESGIYSGISYLETSRNQWNTNETSAKTATATAADLLYNDFVLNYNFNGAEIYQDGDDVSDIKELGVVVERVQELGINQDGSKDTTISHYTSLDQDLDNVRAAANTAASGGQVTVPLNGKKFYKQVVDKTSLDNKNRIKFYDAFYNGAGWNFDNQASAAKYTYKNYVYRAYTYIKYTDENSETVTQLSSAPAYFTMYDEATATYAN